MYPGQFRPGIDAWPGGPPIAAIVAAQQQGQVSYPAPPVRRPADPEKVEAHRVAVEEISAAINPWTRLVRALVHDYEVIRIDGERRSWFTVRRNSFRSDRNIAETLRTPAELWKRLYESYENIVARLTAAETRDVAQWFAREAAARGVPADATVPWPLEPKRSVFGKLKTHTGKAWGPVIYDTGAPAAVWRVPLSVHANESTMKECAALIATDGRLHLPGKVGDRKTVLADFDFDVITLIWLGSRLGMPVDESSTKILQQMLRGAAPARW